MRWQHLFATSALALVVVFGFSSSAQAQETWTDPKTGLTWAQKDNGSDVTQPQALDYCQNLSLAGFRGLETTPNR